MANTEKEVQKALGTYLQLKWNEYCKLHAEGLKLCAEGYKLREEGYKLYIDAVKEVYGPKAIINWKDGSVTV